MDIFGSCHAVNNHLLANDEPSARNELIHLLAEMNEAGLDYDPLVNTLIRQVGLFPYLDSATCSWQERYVQEVFRADVGGGEVVTLHREQSRLLDALLAGESIAVSAPTSFGKSFVIDAFISIRKPSTVVILVPTIALADETRRRLERKFGALYKIITTSDIAISDRNIFVFPQERAFAYAPLLADIDMLVVDEFYKASKQFDKERAPSLIRAIMELSAKAKQRYFLAPNVSELEEGAFTKGMRFLKMDFNTVYLKKTELFQQIGKDEQRKSEVLLRLLAENPGKSLIYAGTYTNIGKLSTLFIGSYPPLDNPLLRGLGGWLAENYDPNWELTKLVTRGIGIHNGRLHRSISQIQIRLFEEPAGLNTMVSTSSIIEGVNTSAENVILWSNRNGQAKINDFTYRNIIGRGGRMFRHFIGKIFVLEPPPDPADTQLTLEYPDELVGIVDESIHGVELTEAQNKMLHAYEAEMQQLVGKAASAAFKGDAALQSSDSSALLSIVRDIVSHRSSWNGVAYLNSDDPTHWDRLLYRLINLRPGYWDIKYQTFVEFVKILSKNWTHTIPELLAELNIYEIGINEFFLLERNTTFKLATLLGDVQTVYNRLYPEAAVDLSPAIARLSCAFLPPIVFVLEEYGLPRMISRKIHASGIMNLEDTDSEIHDVLDHFRELGFDVLQAAVGTLNDFDVYILRYFFEGITRSANTTQ